MKKMFLLCFVLFMFLGCGRHDDRVETIFFRGGVTTTYQESGGSDTILIHINEPGTYTFEFSEKLEGSQLPDKFTETFDTVPKTLMYKAYRFSYRLILKVTKDNTSESYRIAL